MLSDFYALKTLCVCVCVCLSVCECVVRGYLWVIIQAMQDSFPLQQPAAGCDQLVYWHALRSSASHALLCSGISIAHRGGERTEHHATTDSSNPNRLGRTQPRGRFRSKMLSLLLSANLYMI